MKKASRGARINSERKWPGLRTSFESDGKIVFLTAVQAVKRLYDIHYQY